MSVAASGIATGPRLGLEQRQTLTMTPRLAQSIRMLAMGPAEIDAFVRREAERNPFLTRAGPAGNGLAAEIGERTARSVSLVEHLEGQIALAFRDPREAALARRLAGELDEAGYLREPAAALAERLGEDMALMERVLSRCRLLEPAGLFARDLADCLALQLAARDRLDPVARCVLARLDLVARADTAALARLANAKEEDITSVVDDIRSCDPKPGAGFGESAPPPLIPSARIVRAPDGSWRAELLEAALPRVLVEHDYAAELLARGGSPAERAELREWAGEALSRASWLARSLAQRARSIMRVTGEIAVRQSDFMDRGESALRPLTLRAVADTLDLHESTVSRVVAGKSIETPQGTVALRSFFSAGVEADGGALAARAVQTRIRDLLAAETAARVLSDDALARLLREDGIVIARRTVAKYREGLGIASSSVRRRSLAAAGRQRHAENA